jgi:hypothetical protein
MERGGQIGNKNAAKSRMFSDRLRVVLTTEPHRLRAIAEQLVSKAEEGEPWAIRELMDRLEGKAHQSTSLESADGTTIIPHLQVTFIKPDGSD